MLQKIMERLNKKRLRARISTAILGIAMFVSISGIAGAIAVIVVGSRYDSALTNFGFSQGDIGRMMVTFADTRSNLRGVVGYDNLDLVDSCYDAYWERKQKCEDYMATVENTCVSKEEKALYDQILAEIDDYFAVVDELVEEGKDTTDAATSEKLQIRVQNEVVPLYESLYATMLELLEVNTEKGNSLEQVLQIVMLLIILAIIVIIVVAFLIARRLGNLLAGNIVEPLNRLSDRLTTFAKGDLAGEFPVMENEDEVSDMVEVAKEMAENLAAIIGDVNHRMEMMANNDYTGVSAIPEKYLGEFASMNEAIHQMNEDMNQTMRHIEEAASQVSAGAANLAEGSQNLAEGSTDQAGAVEELLASIATITEGVRHTHESAKESYELSTKYAKEADRTQQEMHNVTDSMQQMSEMSQQVESIIGEIEKIAEQTNLLALNASIEAARAGEAGKGFAVVATQIGKLADESAQSAAKTRELIMKSIEQTENGNRAVEKTSATIAELVDGINEVAEKSRTLEQLSETQADQMKQAEGGVNQISEVVQSNAAIAEESSATSEELSAESDSLSNLVQQFKLKKE